VAHRAPPGVTGELQEVLEMIEEDFDPQRNQSQR
jgi:hypothetical protein